MKTFIITTVAICALLPSSLLAQAAAVAEPAPNKVAIPDDHAGISKAITKLMVDMMMGMGSLKDVAEANAQAKMIKALPGKLKPLLDKAESLPAPTDAEKETIKKVGDAAEKKAQEVMMAEMKKNAGNAPDADTQAEIGQVIQGAIGLVDKEMEALIKRLEKLYDLEDEGDSGQ